MSSLNVSLFGGMKVCIESQQNQIKLTRITQLLLAYLLLERNRLHPRDVLAGLLWGERDQQSARSCLNTALWRLRQALEPDQALHGAYLITLNSGEVGFNMNSDYWLDVAVFDERIQRVSTRSVELMQAAEAQELEASLDLYCGDLLEGVYEDWALRAREQKRLHYINGLLVLMHYYRREKEFEKSLAFGQKVIALDPLREEVHRELIHLYLAQGQRALAARQYEICCQSLRDELGILPMEETQALYQQIMDGSQVLQQPPTGWNPADLQQIIKELRQANNNFELAQKQYRHALSEMERLSSRIR
jgi:DNA-binding SARP family transcriptional activator